MVLWFVALRLLNFMSAPAKCNFTLNKQDGSGPTQSKKDCSSAGTYFMFLSSQSLFSPFISFDFVWAALFFWFTSLFTYPGHLQPFRHNWLLNYLFYFSYKSYVFSIFCLSLWAWFVTPSGVIYPCWHVSILRPGSAHLPAFSCAYMESQRRREHQQEPGTKQSSSDNGYQAG